MIRTLSLYISLACGLPAFAGAPFPCVKAVSSRNGSFIVVVETGVQQKAKQVEGTRSGRLDLLSFRVMPKESFINPKDKVISPATYWTDQVVWSVVLDSNRIRNEGGCPLPLITEDGEFLILLRTGPVFADTRPVLQIYRRRDHPGDPVRQGPDEGVFVKDMALADLWPLERASALIAFTDESPQWFAGGKFEFATHRRELIITTRWGNIVRIRLEDGSLTRM